MEKKKKLLLLSYYWPPSGGAGVQRWLKMSKFLAEEFEMTVYVPENPAYANLDEGLEKEVPKSIKILQKKIWEPYSLAAKFTSKNKQYQKGQIDEKKQQNFTSRLSLWLRANFFIPDARAWWIMPSFKFLNDYIKNNPQDIIISTGPPHTMHIIALRLKLRNPNLKWIADFRDPWTQIDYFDKLPLKSSALKKHQKLEKEVLKYADKVVTVSPSWADDLEKIGKRKVDIVYNGFDENDFKEDFQLDKKYFTLTYAGSLNQDRNPSELWKTLNSMCKENPKFAEKFRLQLIGNIDDIVQKEIQNLTFLKKNTIFLSYQPHEIIAKKLQESACLLLLINKTPNEKGIIPGKFFEYMAAKIPILCLGSKGIDIEFIIQQTQSGEFLERKDLKNIKNTLLQWFDLFQKNNLKINPHSTEQYSRKIAALEFIKMVHDI